MSSIIFGENDYNYSGKNDGFPNAMRADWSRFWADF